jgi:hypothetical protein
LENSLVLGLVGQNSGILSNCYSTGDVNGVYYVGGLLGRNAGSVLNCYSTGNVIGTWWYVGGLVGGSSYPGFSGLPPHTPGYIFNSYSIGSVTGDSYVGGLVGQNGYLGEEFSVPGYIYNSYSTCNVNGEADVGGLVGANIGSISNCYSTGRVQGNSFVGGLVGRHYWWSDIETSFWDLETSGEPNMCGDQYEYAMGCDPNCGKTTAEMQTKSTFTDAGWDFVEIWLINEGATNPVLRQEIRSDLNGDDGVDFLDFAIFADHWLEGTAD